MNEAALRACYDTIRVHSKSFALASRLLPPAVRDRAVVVYTWCRHADDAVDLVDASVQPGVVARLRDQLDAVYGGQTLSDPLLAAFQHVVLDCRIPRRYPEDLLAGMEMDIEAAPYDDMPRLLRYCYCVAGTVGLMMCHVMGVSDEGATRHGVHLGMAMQITNICRDVLEDWERQRLYIPTSVLHDVGAGDLVTRLGQPFPPEARVPVARATAILLDEAERYYVSGDAGLCSLSWRCALAVSTARRVYSAIGQRVRAAGCDPVAGRAVVPARRKLMLAGRSVGGALCDGPRRGLSRLFSPTRVDTPRRPLSYPEDVLPV